MCFILIYIFQILLVELYLLLYSLFNNNDDVLRNGNAIYLLKTLQYLLSSFQF